MATLSTSRTYDDGEVLVRADLDAFLDDIETFLNVTKINDDNIQNSGITGSTKLLNSSVTEAKLGLNSVSTLKIQDDAVTADKIADGTIVAANLADDSVTAAKLRDDASVDANRAVTTNHIRDLAVTNAKLATDAVTNDKVADDAIDTDELVDSAVTTAKINALAVTGAKLATTRYTAGTISTGTWLDGTSKSLGSITASGSHPVEIILYTGRITPAGQGINTIDVEYSSDDVSYSLVKRIVDVTTGITVDFDHPATTETWSSATADRRGNVIAIHNAPSAGTAYYRLTIDTVFGAETMTIANAIKYIVREL